MSVGLVFLSFHCLIHATERLTFAGNEHSSLRLRKASAADTTNSLTGAGGDIDTVLKHHHEVQEKLVEGMLHLVTDLKENAKVIGKIAQEDTSVRRAVCCCHHGQILVGGSGELVSSLGIHDIVGWLVQLQLQTSMCYM